MPSITLLFLGICAFFFGIWLIRWLERRRLGPSGSQAFVPLAKSTPPKVAATDRAIPSRPSQAVTQALETEIQQLLDQGQKVRAIKRVREQTGWGLRQAKEYVEHRRASDSAHDLSPEVVAAAKQLMAEGQKIAAIKLIRNHTGWGLKETKEYVEWL